MQRMYGAGPDTPDDDRDVFYYITLYNENYVMPARPEVEGLDEQILRGLYRWQAAPEGPSKGDDPVLGFGHRAQRGRGRGAGRALRRGRRAVVGHELQGAARGGPRGGAVEPAAPVARAAVPLVTQLLHQTSGPITAVTDFMKAVPDQIARFVPRDAPFHVLGTDGMGRSDTARRCAASSRSTPDTSWWPCSPG
jgi:pyruvate dehydrogenase E1 component